VNFKTTPAKPMKKKKKSTKPGTKQPLEFVIRYLFQSATIFPKNELEKFPTKLKDK